MNISSKSTKVLRTGIACLCSLAALLIGVVNSSTPAQAEPFVYVVNQRSDNVSVLDTATNTVVATVGVGGGARPLFIAITPDGTRAYVTNHISSTVSVINTGTNTVVATVRVGTNPWGVAITPDGTKAYVTNVFSSTVSVLDTATNTVVATVGGLGGPRPRAIAITPDGSKAYVTDDTNTNVSVIDISTNTVVAIVVAGTRTGFGNIAITPDGSKAYVTNVNNSTVSVIDTATNTVVATIGIGNSVGIAITADGKKAYVASWFSRKLSVIDTTTNIIADTIILGGTGISLWGVAITPDGAKVYVVDEINGQVLVVDTMTNTLIANVVVGISPRGTAITPTTNQPPAASAGLDQQLDCAGAVCPIILDGSGSTDPDSTTGTNDDIVLFEWFEDFGTPSQQFLAAGEVVTVDLSLGTHAVTLKVTDQGGLTDTDTVQITIDPAKLSMVKVEAAEIDWPEGTDIFAELKLHGMVAPPVGVLPVELAPIGELRLDLVFLDGIDLFFQTVAFEALGMPVDKWEFGANPTGPGIKSFKINWEGAVFKYQDLIELKTNFIGVAETTFSVDRRGMTTPVSLSVNGVDISIDALGNVVTTVPFEIDADGEVTFTLPFELTPDMVITLTVGTDPAQTLLVGDFYTAGKGKFEVIALFDPGALTGASSPADLRVHFALGAEGFPGSVDVIEAQWKDLSLKEWKAKLTN